MLLLRKCFVLLVMLPFAVAQAAPSDQVTPFPPAFPNAQLEQTEQRSVPDYRLILGQLRIIGNQIRSEEQRLTGDLTRQTWRIPSGSSSQDAFNHYRLQLKQMGAEILFACSSRDCGRSGEWATDVFRIPTLYGLDREQNYLAARVEQEGKHLYLAIYTIMRGNQRVYAHVDLISTDGSESTGNDSAQGPRPILPIRGTEFGASMSKELREFSEQAKKDTTKTVWIVVHTQGKSWAESTERGQSFARRLSAWLVTQGVDQQRIRTLAVGPLSPAHNPAVPAERAELFLLKE